MIRGYELPKLISNRKTHFGDALKTLKYANRNDVVAIRRLTPTDLRDFMPDMQDGVEIGFFAQQGSSQWFAVKGIETSVKFPQIPFLRQIHLHPSIGDFAFFLPSKPDLRIASSEFYAVISPTGIARYRMFFPERSWNGMSIENERVRYVFRLSYWDIINDYMVNRAGRLVGPQKPVRLIFNQFMTSVHRSFFIEYLPWELFGSNPAACDFTTLFDPSTSWVS